MKPRTAIAPTIVALALAMSATAQAASLSADRACYGIGDRIGLAGTGFTPNGPVALSADGQQLGVGTVDGTGSFTFSEPAPVVDGKQQIRTYTATDQANLALTASARARVSSLKVTVKPLQGRPAAKRRIKSRGFTRGKVLWAHVKRGNRNRNVKIGKVKGACGTLSVKKRLFKANAATGIYEMRFDTKRRYSTAVDQQYLFLFTVFPVFRPASASTLGMAERWVAPTS